MKNLDINKVILRRKQQILLSDIADGQFNKNLKPYISVLNSNLMQLGYRLSYKLMNHLMMTTEKYILEVQDFLIDNINKMIGNAENMKPLFPNFPETVLSMNFVDTIIFNIIYAELEFDREKFNKVLEVFGIVENEIKDEAKRINTKLKPIDIAFPEDINNLTKNIINAKTAYSEQDREDLDILFDYNYSNIKAMLPESILFKENMVYIVKLLLSKGVNTQEFAHLFKTYTDVLRLAVALSEGDISLAENTYFKNFKRKERKMILQLFNSCKINPEDLFRHKQMYLRLGERIHPGEYREKYPKAFKSFDMLRNEEKKIKKETFNHKREMLFKNKDISGVLELLQSRPGEFARSLNRILVLAKELEYDSIEVIDRFIKLADNIPVSTLISIEEYFSHRSDIKSDRIFYPKGQMAKVYGIENNLVELDEKVCNYATTAIRNKIIEILSKKEPLGKVFIDKNLENYIAPLKMRDASKTLMPLERGSRINIENNKIRLFLHWLDGRPHTDLDLSIILYDEDFKRIDNVSYFNMKIDGCVHSGDVRSAPAPEGGTEYIDIDLEKINSNCYYICVVINAYTYEKFYELPECFVGYMDIDENLNTAYNPSFVKFKGDLTTGTTVSLPYIIDVMANQIVWCDIDYYNLYPINNIKSRKNTTNMIVKNILNSRKPTMDKLVKLNVAARGELVENISEADVIFTDRKDQLLDTDDIIRTREVDVVKTRPVFDEGGNEVGVEEYMDKEIETYEARIVTPFDTDVISSELL